MFECYLEDCQLQFIVKSWNIVSFLSLYKGKKNRVEWIFKMQQDKMRYDCFVLVLYLNIVLWRVCGYRVKSIEKCKINKGGN